MSYYAMSNKELSQTIRKELKAAGFTSKDVSVRVRDSLYDTYVRITVKNPLVKISEVEAIAKKFEEIDRDERTAEILAGCNVFVLCQYEYGIVEDAAAALIPTAEMVLNSPKYDGHAIASNTEKTVHLTRYSENEWTLAEFAKSEKCGCASVFWIRSAKDLAVAMFRFKNFGTIYV